METLKYKVIKSRRQYNEYCNRLENLVGVSTKNKELNDEIELLTLLIEIWDRKHDSFTEMDPVMLIKALMTEHMLKPKDLVTILQVSKGLVSDILNYKKGLSKEVIRALSAHFKVAQEAFNRPYKLKLPINAHLKNASVMNTTKQLLHTA